MKNLAMCLHLVLWLRNLNLIVDNKRCTTIFTTRIGDMLLFSNHWNPIKWVPDGLPRVCLYHPGAVEVVVVGSRVSWRQDASWSGSMDPPTTFRCKGFKNGQVYSRPYRLHFNHLEKPKPSHSCCIHRKTIPASGCPVTAFLNLLVPQNYLDEKPVSSAKSREWNSEMPCYKSSDISVYRSI